MSKEYIDIPSRVPAELIYADAGDEEGGFALVTIIDVGSRRWESDHTLVLRRLSDDTLWGIDYSQGLTENQDNTYPWAPDYRDPPETVVATRLYPHEVTVISYRYTP